jgi:hypothetical protein
MPAPVLVVENLCWKSFGKKVKLGNERSFPKRRKKKDKTKIFFNNINMNYSNSIQFNKNGNF